MPYQAQITGLVAVGQGKDKLNITSGRLQSQQAESRQLALPVHNSSSLSAQVESVFDGARLNSQNERATCASPDQITPQ